MIRLFDTHTHLLDRKFDVDRQALIKTLPELRVVGIIECGTTVRDSKKAAALAESTDYIYSAAGVHPHEAKDAPNDFLIQIKALAEKEKVIAIGEIGLDYHYDFSPKEIQRRVFEQQLDLARKMDIPVIIHMREATEDMLAMLRQYPGLRGVMHCFSGSAETAEMILDMGLYISFTGSVTFNNSRKVVEAAGVVPLDKLMAETDCPYMSPEPVRGTRNNPVNVKYVLAKLAAIKGITLEEMCEANINNVKRLYNI
ncbi:MAG: TatD family hydrolase [Burkholderiales bacterium]